MVMATTTSRTAEYRSWQAMKWRCRNPRNRNYAGRGITVCDRWQDSFATFLSDMGRKPSPRSTLERIDNDGNYEPNNCRWATYTENARNRRCTIAVVVRGKKMTLTDACELHGVKYFTARKRLRAGHLLRDVLLGSRVKSRGSASVRVGVTLHRQSGLWHAYGRRSGKCWHQYCKTKQEAIAARIKWEKR